ncbi:MAG TPA: MmpS family transport accessory protein [Pseudonocardiaceae bacterium]
MVLTIVGQCGHLVGYSRGRAGRATNRGLSLAGAILSAIGLVVCILYLAVFSTAASDINKQANTTVTISYDAGGTAKTATVTYSTFSISGSADGQQDTALPWHKDVQATGFGKGGILTVTAGTDGGTVTCKVTVNGVVQKTATASGAFASATCSNF